ncbi:MAG: ABC transporter substrate-binding protein [Mycobacteriales bacterium]|nr:ABC transporter substrate-binding protein [Mycobacteriales bacterium]
MHPRPARAVRALVALAVSALALSGCSNGPDANASGPLDELRLGYFANVTHASALYGIASGELQRALGSTVLRTSTFSAGPAAIEALRGGALDAAFIGPNPAINGFGQTKGELLRIVAGTTSGGASLVVRQGITSVEELAGRKVATPQRGNTQDVAAKAHFADRGVDVTVVNQDNAQTLELLRSGSIDGGWVPEPWASRLVLDGGGTVLLDEATLWPRGQFVTTHLVVRTDVLRDHPETVDALLRGLIAVTDVVATTSPAVQAKVNEQVLADTGKQLRPEVLASAFARLTPTIDPIATSLLETAKDAQAVGVLRPVELAGIYDLRRLNALLAAAGRPTVSDAGLGAS